MERGRASRVRRPGRVAAFVALIGLCVGLGTGIAYASHAHTINHMYHGMGDTQGSGTDNDYVHPFIDVTDNHNVIQMHFDLYKWAGGQVWLYGFDSGFTGFQHVHVSWDTTPTNECKFYGRFESGQSQDGNHFLNWHRHNHHSYCGG